MINLDEIEAKAKAATPGKWVTNEPASYNTYPGVYLILGGIPNTDAEVVVINDDEATRPNLEYIATAHPTLILEWVKETRRLREFVDEVAQWGGDKESIVPSIALRRYGKLAKALKGGGT